MRHRTRGIREAVRASGADGVIVDVEVTPGATTTRFPDGWNPWRKRLGVRVAAPARDGAANTAVAAVVGDFFGRPATAVRLLSGATDRRKSLEVQGVDPDDAVARLARSLEDEA